MIKTILHVPGKAFKTISTMTIIMMLRRMLMFDEYIPKNINELEVYRGYNEKIDELLDRLNAKKIAIEQGKENFILMEIKKGDKE